MECLRSGRVACSRFGWVLITPAGALPNPETLKQEQSIWQHFEVSHYPIGFV